MAQRWMMVNSVKMLVEIQNDIDKSKRNFRTNNVINKKIIRDEIAISWYRSSILRVGKICKNMECENKLNTIRYNFKDKIERFNSDFPDSTIYILNKELDVIEKHSRNNDDKINNCDEVYIGTNAASISKRNNRFEFVVGAEHYLDDFKDKISISYPIVSSDKTVGYFLIFVNIKKYMSDENNADRILDDKFLIGGEESEFRIFESNDQDIKSQNQIFIPPHLLKEINKNILVESKTLYPSIIIGNSKNYALYFAYQIAKQEKSDFDNIVYLDLSKQYCDISNEIINSALKKSYSIIINVKKNSDFDVNKKISKYIDDNKEELILGNSNKISKIVFIYNNESDIEEGISSRSSKSIVRINDLKQYKDYKFSIVQKMIDYYSDGSKLVEENVVAYIANEIKVCNFSDLENLVKATIVNSKCKLSIGLQDIDCKGVNSHKTLESIEKEYIKKVYREMEYNVSLTSKVLGIGRSTLYRKMNLYQIEKK